VIVHDVFLFCFILLRFILPACVIIYFNFIFFICLTFIY